MLFLRRRRHQLLQAPQPQEFLVRATTRSQPLRAWVSHVRSAVLETILLLHLREWVAQAVLVLPVAQVVQVAQVAQVAHRVPVALRVQADSLEHLVQLVQALPAQVVEHQVVPQAALRVDSLVRAVARVEAVVVALAVEPLVLSVRAVLAVRARLVSQSVRSAKSSNSAAMRHHLVAR